MREPCQWCGARSRGVLNHLHDTPVGSAGRVTSRRRAPNPQLALSLRIRNDAAAWTPRPRRCRCGIRQRRNGRGVRPSARRVNGLGAAPHVECANPHTECAPAALLRTRSAAGRALCALARPVQCTFLVRRCRRQRSEWEQGLEAPGTEADRLLGKRERASAIEKETSMSRVLQRGTAILAVIASLVFATAALAQMPPSPWKKAAPFPEPDEELYGVAVNGKLYVIGGWGERQGSGRQLRVRPGHRQMDEEKVDAAAGPPCGPGRCERQDLRERWLRRPGGKPRSQSAAHGNPSTTCGSTTRRPIPGRRWRRCPASAGPRWPSKSAARST